METTQPKAKRYTAETNELPLQLVYDFKKTPYDKFLLNRMKRDQKEKTFHGFNRDTLLRKLKESPRLSKLLK